MTDQRTLLDHFREKNHKGKTGRSEGRWRRAKGWWNHSIECVCCLEEVWGKMVDPCGNIE
jgi:hypothetical protein